ncbi:carboxylesterase 4A-like [Biomphalaria glabrata]|uniref:Carboxylic ester hydrolase n=1 Tax=Biomphalaria glabrata TaxID=6526 RepID=A0A9W3AF44_BIOGL|nr:carboxylesterase 4A-like [Biomphalaria glabrata]
MEISRSTRLVLVVFCQLTVWTRTTSVEGRRFVDRQTSYGTVRGFVDVIKGRQKVEKYLGVPYAKPPVENLRFEAPEPPDTWAGVRTAYELSPACPQPRLGVDYIQLHVPDFNHTSEDCLYLNIYVPRASRHSQRHADVQHHRPQYAVLVFIHGGSYQNGMGAMMDGSHLATREIIVITFNYRLGPLGFLETNDKSFPGNYGLLDQLEALRWIQKNIHNFGGDPDRVTIDGHSAGGCSVGLLMLMPMAKGLFSRVIQQSGSPFADWAVTRQPITPNFYFKIFTTAVGCYGNGTAEVKTCLKELPSDVIERVILEQPEHPVSLVPPFRPVVDGAVLPDTPEKLAATGEINGDEILTGTTTDEGLMAAVPLLNNYGVGRHGLQRLQAVISGFSVDLPAVRSLLDNVMEQYYQWPYEFEDEEIKKGFAEIVGDYFISAPTQQTADLLSSRNVTVYFYNFDYLSQQDRSDGVYHGVELFYLSGYPLTGHDNFRYNDVDKTMAIKLMQLWVNYVQHGLPSLEPLEEFHMSPYTISTPSFTRMTLVNDDATLLLETSFKQSKMAFWNNFVPNLYLHQLRRDIHLLNTSSFDSLVPACKRCLQSYVLTQPSSSWILITACIGLSILTILLSAFYCQVRRKVKTLIRQSSVSSGQAIL